MDVSTTTVINFESGQINTTRMIQKAFKGVFEEHGVVFIEGDSEPQTNARIKRVDLEDGTAVEFRCE
ncbi:MAG: hypothetical protein ACPG4T_23165 [Nannocystaceae bacterium]